MYCQGRERTVPLVSLPVEHILDSACESMGMGYEEYVAMYDQMASGMMSTSCH